MTTYRTIKFAMGKFLFSQEQLGRLQTRTQPLSDVLSLLYSLFTVMFCCSFHNQLTYPWQIVSSVAPLIPPHLQINFFGLFSNIMPCYD